MAIAEYIVQAGNNKGGSENCKFHKVFDSLESALSAQEDVSDHPWYRIVVREGEFEYLIEPRRIKRLSGGEYLPCTTRGQLLESEG